MSTVAWETKDIHVPHGQVTSQLHTHTHTHTHVHPLTLIHSQETQMYLGNVHSSLRNKVSFPFFPSWLCLFTVAMVTDYHQLWGLTVQLYSALEVKVKVKVSAG